MGLAGKGALQAQKLRWADLEADKIIFIWGYLGSFLRRPHVSNCLAVNRLKNVCVATAKERHKEEVTGARPIARPLAPPRVDPLPLEPQLRSPAAPLSPLPLADAPQLWSPAARAHALPNDPRSPPAPAARLPPPALPDVPMGPPPAPLLSPSVTFRIASSDSECEFVPPPDPLLSPPDFLLSPPPGSPPDFNHIWGDDSAPDLEPVYKNITMPCLDLSLLAEVADAPPVNHQEHKASGVEEAKRRRMSRKQTADDTHVGKRCKKKAATPTTMMTMTTVAIAPMMTPKVRKPCKKNAATPPKSHRQDPAACSRVPTPPAACSRVLAPPQWFVASLAETDITAASAEDIVSLLAGGLHDPCPSGRVKESVQRGRHIVQLFHGTAIVQVVRETTGLVEIRIYRTGGVR